MSNTYCYSGCGWRVYRYNNLIGYVFAKDRYSANMIAKIKYGEYIYVEKILAP